MTKEMNDILIKQKIASDLDFISNPRFENSLKKIMERYVDGCPEHIIKKSLLLGTVEMQNIHKKAIKTLADSIVN